MDIEQSRHFGEQAAKLAELFVKKKVLKTSEIMQLHFGSHTRRVSDLREAGWIIKFKKISISEGQYTFEGFRNVGQQELFQGYTIWETRPTISLR